MSQKTKTITVEICIPVSIKLQVSWDVDEATIESVELSHLQYDLTPTSLGEHMSDDDFEEVDRLTMKAFEVEA